MRRQSQAGPWGLLASQNSLLGELQAREWVLGTPPDLNLWPPRAYAHV